MMEEKYIIPLKSIETEFELEPVWVPENMDECVVERADISRPGLPLAGFYENFEASRLQLIGYMEHSYLASLSADQRRASLRNFFEHQVKAVVVTTNLEIYAVLAIANHSHITVGIKVPSKTIECGICFTIQCRG